MLASGTKSLHLHGYICTKSHISTKLSLRTDYDRRTQTTIFIYRHTIVFIIYSAFHPVLYKYNKDQNWREAPPIGTQPKSFICCDLQRLPPQLSYFHLLSMSFMGLIYPFLPFSMPGEETHVTALHLPLLTMQLAYGQGKKSPALAEASAYVGNVSATLRIWLSVLRVHTVNMTTSSVPVLLGSSATVSETLLAATCFQFLCKINCFTCCVPLHNWRFWRMSSCW